MTVSTSISGRLNGKVAIVTGSSSGLGRAIALAFAAQGTRLIICADLQEKATSNFSAIAGDGPTHEVICEHYGDGKAIFVKTNVTVADQVQNLVEQAVNHGGRLDIIVNNAGVLGLDRAAKIHEMQEDYWDFMMATNGRSVFLGCKFACGQFMRQEPHSSGHRGWIINVASVLGLVGIGLGAGAYCASKGLVIQLTKQIGVDYAKDKVHCNVLCPGFLKTPSTQMFNETPPYNDAILAGTPMNEWGNAEDIARGAVFLASDDAAFITGASLAMDGGFTAQ